MQKVRLDEKKRFKLVKRKWTKTQHEQRDRNLSRKAMSWGEVTSRQEKTGEKVDSKKKGGKKKHRDGGFAETELEEMCLFSWPERFNQLHVSAVNHKACHLSVGARGKLENKLWFHCSHCCHYKAGTKKKHCPTRVPSIFGPSCLVLGYSFIFRENCQLLLFNLWDRNYIFAQ